MDVVLTRKTCIKCSRAFHTDDEYEVCSICAPTQAMAVIESMPLSKKIYARFYWEWLKGTYPRCPQIPHAMSAETACDIRMELSMYDIATGEKMYDI